MKWIRRFRVSLLAACLFAGAVIATLRLLSMQNRGDRAPEDPYSLLTEANRLSWLGNWDSAGRFYERAEGLFHVAGDHRNEVYAQVGRLRANTSAIPLTEVSKLLENELRDPSVRADAKLRLWCLAAKGYTDFDLDTESAKRSWLEALKLATELDDQRWASRATGELGLIAFVEGDTATAVSLVGKALWSAYESRDVGAEIEYLTMAGIGFNEERRFSEALPFFKLALAIAKRNPDAGFPYMVYEGEAASLIGLGQESDAERLLQQVLSAAESHGRPAEKAQALIEFGDLAMAHQDLAAAKGYFGEASQDFQEAGIARGLDEASFKLAGIYRQQGRLDEATKALNVGLRALGQNDRYYQPRILTALAEVKAAQKRPKEADRLFQQAEDIIDSVMMRLRGDFEAAAVAGTMSETYIEHFKLVMKQANVARAFTVVERVRGKNVSGLVQADEDPGSKPRVTALVDGAITNLQRVLLNTQDPTARSNLLNELTAYERVRAFEENEVALNRRQLAKQPAPLKSVQASLRDDELLVEYVLDEPTSFCLAITRQKAKIFMVAGGKKSIDDLSGKYLKKLNARESGTEAATKLYSILLGPILATFPKPRLIVSPDGGLHHLPFEALRDTNGLLLIRSKIVSYTPSASALATLRNAKRLPLEHLLLAVGAVDYRLGLSVPHAVQPYSFIAGVLRGLSELKGSRLEDLPESRDEVLSIARAFPQGSVVLLGRDATESAFKAQPLADYRVIHLAVHAFPDQQFPYRASLVLGADPDKAEDGLLQVREITRLRLNADLITLSACETGVGPLQGEAGMASLQQAFLTAGARAVVASLWRVEDHSTTALMKAFYTHLAGKEDKALALANAKRDVLKRYGDLSPYYWASFVLAGEGAEDVFASR